MDWALLNEKLRRLIEPRRDEMVADLARYVAIPTGFNHTPGLDTFRALLIARLEALGATTHVMAGEARPTWLDEPGDGAAGAKVFLPPVTVVCRRPRDLKRGGKRVLLSGHLDTVFDPRGAFQTMRVSADGKTAIGPGVVDMKGGILVALVALEALAAAGVEPSWSFILNSDEETGSYASDKWLRAEARGHDVGIALEPALPNGGLVVERKGSGQFIIETFGRPAHAGRDFEKGVSAVYALARAVLACEGVTDLARGVTVNVGPLRGGKATNIVPDAAAAWGNIRFPDDASGAAAMRAIEALATSDDAMPRVRVRGSLARPAKPKTPGTEALAMLARETAEALGQTLPFGTSGGVCDGNNLQAEGLTTIDTMGVRGGGLHTEQEWIELASLTERATLLACVLARLTGE
jgi:glutamate carboxypeptidase